uniref:Uncharacterized protein n=1 Tax=Vannella robusta TaxID=1487602 RepID=A0A7S4M6U0_9EUKA
MKRCFEGKLAVQYSVNLLTLIVYDLMSIINVIMIFEPLGRGAAVLLWLVCAIDMICICYVFLNFAWTRTTNESYYRTVFEYPITMVAITISLGAVSIGSFVIWADDPALGPQIVHKCMGYVFLTAWWYLAYVTNPPKEQQRWNLHFSILIIMGIFQTGMLLFSFIWATKTESNETMSEIGVAKYLVSVFENVLLVEIVHLALESVLRCFQPEEQSEHKNVPSTTEEPVFSIEMILIIISGLVMLANILIGIVCLVLREVYYQNDTHASMVIESIQMSVTAISCIICVLIVGFLLLRFRRSGKFAFPVSELLEIMGTLVFIAVFFVAFFISGINSYEVSNTRTLLGIMQDSFAFSFIVVWWSSSLLWHRYVSKHKNRLQLMHVLLRVLVITTTSFVILVITDNILHESASTVDVIPLPIYVNSVSQNVLFFELLHLITGTKHFYHKIVSYSEDTELQSISLRNYGEL